MSYILQSVLRLVNFFRIKYGQKPDNDVGLLDWCHLTNVIQASAVDLQNDYTLKDLAEEFQLSGELLAA